jgi:hypothetical protein
MSAFVTDLAGEPVETGPTVVQRVIYAFTSPSKAFTGTGLSKSWWLPFVLTLLVGLGFTTAIGSKVGWDVVARNAIASSPKQQAKIDQMPADAQTQQMAMIGKITKISTLVAVAIGPLIFGAIVAGVLLASLNFMLGGDANFGGLFSVYFFSTLPGAVKALLAALLLFAGVGSETFNLKMPLGSNPAYYLSGSTTSPVLLSLLSWFDIFLIWQVVLVIIGSAIVARVSRGKAAAVVVAWMVLGVVVSTAFAAI